MRLRWVVGGTVFLGAFLLFLVEPMAAKALLPVLGGSSAVWVTCLVFFQGMLLAGYGYAHWLSRGGHMLRWVLVGLLVVGVGMALEAARLLVVGDALHPVGTIFRSLGLGIGVPFLLLGSTSPLLQVWMARVEGAGVRYGWFGLSNVGSLLGLICYPLVLEPYVSLRGQRVGWGVGFAVWAGLMGWIGWGEEVWGGRSRAVADATTKEEANPGVFRFAQDDDGRQTTTLDRDRSVVRREEAATDRAPRSRRWMWFLLPMGAAMQLAAVTSHLTVNIAAIPLLWMLPLGAYLVSFILAFDFPGLYQRAVVGRLVAVMLAGLGYALTKTDISVPIGVGIPFFLAELFAACWFCHAEVYRLRPMGRRQATEFYLMVAGGGVAGTFLVGIASPLLFSANYDLGLAFAVTALLAWKVTWGDGWGQRLLWGVGSALLVVVVGLLHVAYGRDVLQVARNFYGTLRVTQKDSATGPVRMLANGTIQHGTQIFPWQNPGMEREPTTYYAEDSGVGLALKGCCAGRAKHVGVIGLGVGTLAAYGMAGDTMRFYEINPLVRPVAERWFTYLKDSGAAITFAEGDGRATLERESPQGFDVLVVDAFSGDAIPVHLLTVEAMAVYRRHLAPDGVLAFHVSNQYLNLMPEIGALARAAGTKARVVESRADAAKGEYRATWVLVGTGRWGVPVAGGGKAWTDDYSSILPLVEWGGS